MSKRSAKRLRKELDRTIWHFVAENKLTWAELLGVLTIVSAKWLNYVKLKLKD